MDTTIKNSGNLSGLRSTAADIQAAQKKIAEKNPPQQSPEKNQSSPGVTVNLSQQSIEAMRRLKEAAERNKINPAEARNETVETTNTVLASSQAKPQQTPLETDNTRPSTESSQNIEKPAPRPVTEVNFSAAQANAAVSASTNSASEQQKTREVRAQMAQQTLSQVNTNPGSLLDLLQ